MIQKKLVKNADVSQIHYTTIESSLSVSHVFVRIFLFKQQTSFVKKYYSKVTAAHCTLHNTPKLCRVYVLTEPIFVIDYDMLFMAHEGNSINLTAPKKGKYSYNTEAVFITNNKNTYLLRLS